MAKDSTTPAAELIIEAHPAETLSTEDYKAQFVAEAQRFREAFGDVGAVWFLEGKSFEQCSREHTDALAAENASLKQQVAELQKRLDAATQSAGEASPVDFQIGTGEQSEAQRQGFAGKIRMPHTGN